MRVVEFRRVDQAKATCVEHGLRGGVWCVAFDDKNSVVPFAKVAKQMDYGLDDGLASFFNLIPVIFETYPERSRYRRRRRSRGGNFGADGDKGIRLLVTAASLRVVKNNSECVAVS